MFWRTAYMRTQHLPIGSCYHDVRSALFWFEFTWNDGFFGSHVLDCDSRTLLEIGCSITNNQVSCSSQGLTKIPCNIPSSTQTLFETPCAISFLINILIFIHRILSSNQIAAIPAGAFQALCPNVQAMFVNFVI